MKQRCTIYFMASGFHVVSQSVTIHGIGVDTEPMFIVETSETDEALGSKVFLALRASREDIPPPNPADLSKQLLSFLKEKSWKNVGRKAKLIDLVFENGAVTIFPS